ncbi:alanine--tRNA ligase [Candidatus Kaiserbacteria bacterium]|nr:alanine--tRNA ligase [Candidatus Kaiserbacteria bacterium]
MTVSEVRKRYLEFFKARGHVIIPSAPIVPEGDPTTLFTSSGMQPLLPYFLGKDHPEGKRIADSQPCFRAADIEEVGDNRHTTFFEMLGNWSFGDYFKKEQLAWFYEFLTKELGIESKRLWITCFAGDDSLGLPKDEESARVWQKLGIPPERISFYGPEKNWWSRSGQPGQMPAGEPGGPDSEVFYDFQTLHDAKFGATCHPNCDCGRFVEIGNSVFMQYLKLDPSIHSGQAAFGPLPKRSVDFGGGLERITAARASNPDIFLIDVFHDARKTLEQRSGKRYGEDGRETKSFRIILDHIRAAAFMLASGIRPASLEAGYVLRRLIRRAIRHADALGIKGGVLAEAAHGCSTTYSDAYPMMQESAATIRDELTKEEEKFRRTLAQGLREFEKMKTIDAFALFTTYGFPLELTKEIARERGLSVDHDAFLKQMEAHQAKSRAGAAGKFTGGLADHAEQTIRYHTAHHLLLAALRQVLGKDVHQRGSNITTERLRIDFSYGSKMTPEQIAHVEKIVNKKIAEALPVVRTVMPREEAEKLGAEHEFGVKYPEQVSVYSVGPLKDAFSIEFCGGPHVENTAEIGSVRDPDGTVRKGVLKFKIVKEEAVAAGVRRIKAVLE